MGRVLATSLCLVGVLLAGSASASVGEVLLPAGSKPLALAFDEAGALWVTLDGPWAFGRVDLATGNLTTFPLAAPRAGELDSLAELAVAPDGRLWTASTTHAHVLDPASGAARAIPFGAATNLAGDLAFVDGKVLVATVDGDALVEVDPGTGDVRAVPTGERTGPLMFASEGGELYVTLTYANTVARVDGDDLTPVVPPGSVQGPVGAGEAPGALWVAEMGGSSVSRIDLASGDAKRWPTAPSSFYVISGPSDVLVVDGKVWFVEHFADRLSVLDPDAGTLVERLVPSAPGANVQRIARAPDGRVFAAAWSTDRLVWARDDAAPAPPSLPPRFEVESGGAARLPVAGGAFTAVVEPPGPKVAAGPDGVDVDAGEAAAGTYRLLVSQGDRELLVGRYVDLVVVAATPGPSFAALLFLAAGLAVASRRRAA